MFSNGNYTQGRNQRANLLRGSNQRSVRGEGLISLTQVIFFIVAPLVAIFLCFTAFFAMRQWFGGPLVSLDEIGRFVTNKMRRALPGAWMRLELKELRGGHIDVVKRSDVNGRKHFLLVIHERAYRPGQLEKIRESLESIGIPYQRFFDKKRKGIEIDCDRDELVSGTVAEVVFGVVLGAPSSAQVRCRLWSVFRVDEPRMISWDS